MTAPIRWHAKATGQPGEFSEPDRGPNLESSEVPEDVHQVAEFYPDPSMTDVTLAEKYLEKWAHTFGFAHYRRKVHPIRVEDAGGFWARCFFDHDEEWLEIEIVPDGVVPEAQTEHLILHELCHGLFEYAAGSDSHEEAACNRLARFCSGLADGTNFTMYGDGYWRALPDQRSNHRGV